MPYQPSDFDLIASMRSDEGIPTELKAALDNMRGFQASLATQNKQNEQVLPPQSIQVNTEKGTVTMKDLPIATYEAFNRDRQELNQIRGAFHEQAQRLKYEEERARAQPPWVQLATALSANLAQAKDMPGWVQGLGRTAAQLNPQPDVLAARRLGVLGEEAQLAEKSVALDIAQQRLVMDTKQAELERKRIEGANKTAAEYLKQARLAVRPGSGEPLSYGAFQDGAIASGVAPDRIPGLYRTHVEEAKLAAAGKEADLARAKEKMTFKEQLDETLAKKRGEISIKNRLTAIDHAFRNSISGSKEEYDLKLFEQKEAIRTATAGRKELSVLGPKVSDGLKQASATNQYLGSSQEMLEQPEMAAVQGPLFQFNPATNEVKLNPQAVIPKSFQNVDRTIVTSQIAHEIPRLLTLLLNGQQGGASILRIEAGQKLVRDMGITGAIRVDQALQILKIVRDSNNNNVASYMREKPRAAWWEMKDLIGATDPLNDYYFKERRDIFGKPLVPFPNFERRGAEEPKTPSETKPKGKYYDVEKGQWIEGA